MSELQRFNKLVGKEGVSFRNTLERARQLHQLSSLITQCLDPAIAQHCQLANVRGDTLVIQSDSPGWASKLRYLGPQIINCLQQHQRLRAIKRIKVRVAPLAQPIERSVRRMQLSPENAQLIDSLADSITDQALGAALRRLASHRS